MATRKSGSKTSGLFGRSAMDNRQASAGGVNSTSSLFGKLKGRKKKKGDDTSKLFGK